VLADYLPRVSSFESATSPTAMMHLADAEVKGGTGAMVNVQVRVCGQLICFSRQHDFMLACMWLRRGPLHDLDVLWHAGGRQPALLWVQCIFNPHSIPRTRCINRLFRDAVSELSAHSVDQAMDVPHAWHDHWELSTEDLHTRRGGRPSSKCQALLSEGRVSGPSCAGDCADPARP